MKIRLLASVLVLYVLTLLGAGRASAQGSGAQWTVEGVAGLFTTQRRSDPADNGPLFAWRYSTPITSRLYVGGQVQFRDDDPSYGRSQALGVGVAARATLGTFYIPVGGLLEGVQISKDPVDLTYFPQPKPGFYIRPRVQAGLGVELGSGPVRFLIEGQSSYGFDGNILALTAGLRSTSPNRSRDRPRILMHSNEWGALGRSYGREEDFRGYGLRYELPVDAAPLESVRGSLGIDFLKFVSNRPWSTGAISALVGGRVPLASAMDGTAALSAVADGGIWFFSEGGGGRITYPLAMGGVELSISARGITPVAGIQGVLADAPAGTLSGARLSLGVGVGL